MKYTSAGKEVLCDGKHFADAVDDEAARVIVNGLNYRQQAFNLMKSKEKFIERLS